MSSLPERPECRRRAGGDRIAVGEEDDAGLQLKCQNRSAVICVQRSSSNTGNGFSLDKSAATAHKLGFVAFLFLVKIGPTAPSPFELYDDNDLLLVTPQSLCTIPPCGTVKGNEADPVCKPRIAREAGPILSPPCVKSSV